MDCEKCYHYEVCSLVDFKRRSKIDFCANYKASNCIIELPCPVGTKVYIISDTSDCNCPDEINCPQENCYKCPFEIMDCDIYEDTIQTDWQCLDIKSKIGKTVFFDHDKAEEALNERKARFKEERSV